MTQYLLGFDIGGTNARSALIAANQGQFKILSAQKTSIRGSHTPNDVALVVRRVIENVTAEHQLEPNQLSGIGIAIAGQIAIDEHTILNAPNLNWHDIDFDAVLRQQLDDLIPNIRIRIANDLNAIAWGEYHFGAAHNLSGLLAVYVGTGIGAGLIHDRQLLLGADNVSGEIGHCKFPSLADIPCGCGQFGCVEGYAGGKAIEYRILHDIQTGLVAPADLGLSDGEHPSAKNIEKYCRLGLPYAVKFWDDTALIIGMLIANAIAILNPQALLLGGGVLEGCPELMSRVVSHIMNLAPRAATANLQFIKPTLHDDAGTLGAALLCLNA